MSVLPKAANSLEDALLLYRTSNSNWEHADSYFYNTTSTHNPQAHKVIDPPLRLKTIQPLPPSFISQYSNVQYRSYMGLFPQIHRAWLTIDSKLYLWAYTPVDQDGNAMRGSDDFYVYEGLSQIIVCVALVVPRQGVFVDNVQWLLVVATPVEVTLLGITFCNDQLNLVPTNISVPTDNTLILKMQSTPDGRIFMAGADGTLHEFEYGHRPGNSIIDLITGRPTKRARKVAHNTTSISQLLPHAVKNFFAKTDEIVDLSIDRSVLYTLSQSAMLSVYDISGVSGGVAAISSVNVRNDMKSMAIATPSRDREFISIHSVPYQTSNIVQLIVVTSLGERLYYSTTNSARRTRENARHKPRTLRVVSFRDSPDRHARSNRPCMHMALCERGAAVFADLREAESDKLFCVFPDSTLPALINTGSEFGGVEKTAEIVFEKSLTEMDGNVENRNIGMMNTPMARHYAPAPDAPKRTFAIVEAGVGHRDTPGLPPEPPVFFWILTSSSMRLYERTMPIYRLKQVLSTGPDARSEIEKFFGRYGTVESCAMCLQIAVKYPQLAATAAKVFYTNGGEPVSSSRRDEHRHGDGRMSNGGGFDIGRPSMPPVPLARFSAAYEGTAWFIAKLVHPIWNSFLTSDRNPDGYQNLGCPPDLLKHVREQLLNLISFLDKFTPEDWLPEAEGNEENKSRLANGSDWRRRDRRRDEEHVGSDGIRTRSPDRFRGIYQLKKTSEARQKESSSIAGLRELLIKTVEALALLLIMAEHQVHRLVMTMPKESREQLVEMKLNDLVISEEGMQVSSSIIKAMFKGYNDEDAALKSLGQMLKDRCASYFGDLDVELHRGITLLRMAKDIVAGIPKQLSTGSGAYDPQVGMLDPNSDHSAAWERATSLAERAAGVIKSAAGRVFDIATICQDFQAVGAFPALVDVALTVGKVAENKENEQRAKLAYDMIFAVLGHSLDGADFMDDGRDGMVPVTDRMRDAMMRVAFQSDSELFVQGLFELLMSTEKGRDELLKQDHVRLEQFLREKQASDLLWRYCARHNRNLEAAGVLQKMAEVDEEVSLVDRLNYLSCGLHNAKTAMAKGVEGAGEQLNEISDYIEVAKVQLRVREELRQRHENNMDAKVALEELDGEIQGLSSLFNKYARPFDLYESSLDILRCGSYRDEGYVKGLWANIVEREAETGQSAAGIRQKLETLGREFYPNETIFPTAFLLDTLQRLVYRNFESGAWRESHDWVVGMMKTIGVPLPEIIEGYRRMLENTSVGDGFTWSEERAQVHLLQVIERVIGVWFRDSEGGDGHVLSEADKALRAISLCKSRLRGMSCGEVDELTEMFDRLEKKIAPHVRGAGLTAG